MLNSYIFIIFIFFFGFCAQTQAGPSIKLATTQWCPYTCGDENSPHGMVGHLVKQLMMEQGVSVEIQSYPWSRALQLAKARAVDGLLTSTHNEAPFMIFSRIPIGSFQMCFYTHKRNTWLFDKKINVRDNKLTIINNYGYGEPLDSYIQENKSVIKVSGDNATERLIMMLVNKRTDIIVEDPAVLQWFTKQNNIDISDIKKAGCLDENVFYLALTSTEFNRQVMSKLNYKLEQLALINISIPKT